MNCDACDTLIDDEDEATKVTLGVCKHTFHERCMLPRKNKCRRCGHSLTMQEAAGPLISIYVKGLSDFFVQVTVSPWMSVAEFKCMFQCLTNVPADQQRFICGGRQLRDELYIRDYGIEPCATVHIVLRLRGD